MNREIVNSDLFFFREVHSRKPYSERHIIAGPNNPSEIKHRQSILNFTAADAGCSPEASSLRAHRLSGGSAAKGQSANRYLPVLLTQKLKHQNKLKFNPKGKP